MVARLAARVRSLLTRRRAERELDEELRFHVEMETRANVERGMAPLEARRRALVELGGVDQTREAVRDQRALWLLDSVRQDVRFALRSFRRTPGFTTVALLTIAVAIGASTTVFSVVEAVLLRALPYGEPDRLYTLWTVESRSHRSHHTSYPDYADWAAQTRAFAGLAAFRGDAATLTGTGEPERTDLLRCTPNLLSILGVRPLLGRAFTASDGSHAALVSHRLWRQGFAGEDGLVGREIQLDGERYLVTGVLPPDLHFPPYRFEGEPDLFVPLAPQLDRDIFSLRVVGRLSPGATAGQARREMDAIASRLNAARPASSSGRGIDVSPLSNWAAASARRPALLLLGAVACVLLIACANLAHLLMARGASRRTELAVRVGLGASRQRVCRQLLTENLLLALAGGALGVLVAHWSLPLVAALTPPRSEFFTRLHDAGLRLNGTVLAFAVSASAVSGLLFGLVPALRSLSQQGLSATRVTARLRGSLLLTEIALSFVLLTAASLMVRTLVVLADEDPGFRTDRVLSAGISLPEAKYSECSGRAYVFGRVLARVEALPGVESVGLVDNLPLTGNVVSNSIALEGAAAPSASVAYGSVSPGYFGTMGMVLVRGRGFRPADSERAPRVAIVNQSMARRFWPGTDAIGKAVLATRAVQERTPAGDRLRFEQERCEIVGIVSDARAYLDEAPRPAVFFPFAQRPSLEMTLVARSSGNPAATVAELRACLRTIDAALPLVDVRTMDEWVDRELAPRRFLLLLLGAFALVAAALGAIGIYGVGAFGVSTQVREIGVRISLGASRPAIALLVVRQHGPWILGGIATGLGAAWSVTRLLSRYLYGVKPTDAVTFAATAAALLAAAAAAYVVPVRRALGVNPAEALRRE